VFEKLGKNYCVVTLPQNPKLHHFTFGYELKKKEDEQRTLFLPSHVNKLVEHGYQVTVEESSQRCVPIKDYRNCAIAPEGSWVNAPKDAIITGLKELPVEDFPLHHQHMYFAHVYKGQFGASKLLNRFRKGKGVLYDLEYLVDNLGKRVAAFGVSAGMSGAAIGALVWAFRVKNGPQPDFPSVTNFADYNQLTEYVLSQIAPLNRKPTAIVVGDGRVGTGAINFLKSIGVEPVVWNKSNTKRCGPYRELLDFDIFINAILFSEKDDFIFLDSETLSSKTIKTRTLNTIVDISCDINNPKNPLPLYKELTSFKHPSKHLPQFRVDVIQIDHLPSLIPLESSNDFADQLLPHVLQFGKTAVWMRAIELFQKQTKIYEEDEYQY